MKANGGPLFAFRVPGAGPRPGRNPHQGMTAPECRRQEGARVPSTIELRAFMGLSDEFRKRRWSNPKEVVVQGEMTGTQLLELLDLSEDMVEVIFVNGKASKPEATLVTGGDRVALAPPGVPGPYRVLLGFKKMG